ncbi:hypothetical protein Tco_0699612 [Tanacetum coccineum]
MRTPFERVRWREGGHDEGGDIEEEKERRGTSREHMRSRDPPPMRNREKSRVPEASESEEGTEEGREDEREVVVEIRSDETGMWRVVGTCLSEGEASKRRSDGRER